MGRSWLCWRGWRGGIWGGLGGGLRGRGSGLLGKVVVRCEDLGGDGEGVEGGMGEGEG